MTEMPITALDLTGFEPFEHEQIAWRDADGTALTLHYFELPPDLPAPLDEVARLRAGRARSAAEAGGGLVECEVEPVDGVPALRQIIKLPHWQGHGQVFLGSYTIPRATCSTVIKLQAPEYGDTGMREAVIAARIGFEDFITPSPYAPGLTGGLPSHRADDPRYDEEFPQHPLSLVRAKLARLGPSIRLDERFKALPAFG
ncbi:hypothetical protein ACQP1P_11145 [Dactylosporangium sp. CA-052675]|uniref:hypothetical protein n=1 Tax=Dactylosporangium sp. CA-052675 TaxID=3239927 RepID=UPI003D9290A9